MVKFDKGIILIIKGMIIVVLSLCLIFMSDTILVQFHVLLLYFVFFVAEDGIPFTTVKDESYMYKRMILIR